MTKMQIKDYIMSDLQKKTIEGENYHQAPSKLIPNLYHKKKIRHPFPESAVVPIDGNANKKSSCYTSSYF